MVVVEVVVEVVVDTSEFAGRTAVVTGAANGIGAAVATRVVEVVGDVSRAATAEEVVAYAASKGAIGRSPEICQIALGRARSRIP